MSAEVLVPLTNIEELVTQILMDRQISRSDQLLLKCARICQTMLNEQEQILIDRVLYGVRHGLVKIVE
ncbi:MAG TPA: hypothetical protein DD379_13450 [Cyanobacteria bacterium UBA11162]|nr:hypothetical protein [Cyanobacteria bacterium UBA12227]HAX87919.1 hypothetical protein [Cyanobacteria bacterium UBA11370]HBL12387.1 hypothetical protein [Cyanobacteria bacterium UBA11162]HBY80829.1 hypothetical protein [Cyanobacteria bacterium UBA11148]